MPQLSIHLSFDGDCAQAFAFYGEVFGGKPNVMTYGASPGAGQVAASEQGRVMHANLAFGQQQLMGADATSGHPFRGRSGYDVSVSYPNVEEARRVYDALAAGGTRTMPFEPTFWSPGFGMVVDRFGISWMVSCDGPSA